MIDRGGRIEVRARAGSGGVTPLTRWAVLAAAVVMQLCLGATYAWAVFVAPLKSCTGLGQGPIQTPFTLFYVAFPATTIVAGALLPRLGPRRSAAIGGVVFGGGWMLAGLGGRDFLFTTLGVGLLGGIGVGFAYLVPIATCILWFPRHRGLVTGVAVAGFGGGAALVSRVADALLGPGGLDPFAVLTRLGLGFAVLVPAAGVLMRRPEAYRSPVASARRDLAVLGDRRFRLLYFAMFAGLTAGLGVNANLRELAPSVASVPGISAVAAFAIFNAAGRLSWGFVFDRVDTRAAVIANLLAQAVWMFGAPWILRLPGSLVPFAAVAGFNYGGVLVVYASATARCWGAGRVGGIYGWLFSSNIPASLAPLLAGWAFDVWGSFRVPLLAIGGLLVLAVALVLRHGPLETDPAARATRPG